MQGTVVAIHFHQPNGYLQLADSTIIATALGWPSQTYPYNSSVALFMGGGSLNVVNCDLENQAGEGWRDPGARVRPNLSATSELALNVAVILTYPCIFCMDNR